MSNSVKWCLKLKLDDMSDGNKTTFCGGRSCRVEDEGSGDSEFRLTFSRNLSVKRRGGMVWLSCMWGDLSPFTAKRQETGWADKSANICPLAPFWLPPPPPTWPGGGPRRPASRKLQPPEGPAALGGRSRGLARAPTVRAEELELWGGGGCGEWLCRR